MIGHRVRDRTPVRERQPLKLIAVRIAGSDQNKETQVSIKKRRDSASTEISVDGDGVRSEPRRSRGVVRAGRTDIASLGVPHDDHSELHGELNGFFEQFNTRRAKSLEAGALRLECGDAVGNGVHNAAAELADCADGIGVCGLELVRDVLNDGIQSDAGRGSRTGNRCMKTIGEVDGHASSIALQVDKPKNLDLKKDRGLTVEWEDGSTSYYSIAYLRKMSPSADMRNLREQMQKNPLTVLPATASRSGPIIAESAELVGNYAIRIRFSDGHDTGIYSWVYLREIDPARNDDPPKGAPVSRDS